MTKKIVCLATLLSCCTSLAVSPYISIRSQSENAARELVGAGWNTQIHLPDKDDVYGNISITPEYTRSFRPCRIAECLFGCFSCCCNQSCDPCSTACNSCCNPCWTSCSPCGSCNTPCCDNDCYRIRVSGSQVTNRGTCDWLADYFGLPTDYQSCVTFEPRIENFLIDFNFYFGMDKWCKGMYFRIHAPVVATRWDLNMCECVVSTGTADHIAGYFNPTLSLSDTSTIGILRSNLVSSFTSFITGCGVINSDDIIFEPLYFAKMDCCKRKKAGLSDIQFAVGWNLWRDEDYNAGFNIRTAMPTGNRPNAHYLFEPIVGNGKHWELGVGFTGQWTFWRSEEEERNCSFFCDANVTHLFKAKQCRTFDLRCKPLSRYMLAAQFGTPVRNLKAGDTTGTAVIPSKQFKGLYTPVANLTTFRVDVSSAAQADLVLMFQYIHNKWSIDLGYNFWCRSCEKIEPRCDCACPFEENTWGLKGDAFMYGYYDYQGTVNAVALSATQSKATICKGTNTDDVDNIPWYRNPGVDNRKLAWNTVGAGTALYAYLPTGLSAEQVYTSMEPILIRFCDIDFDGAHTKGLSHKIFGHADYTWKDREKWIPYLGIGFEVEFAHRSDCNYCCGNCCYSCGSCGPCSSFCNPCSCGPCSSPYGCQYDLCCYNSCCCNYCAINQWGIWLKGGVSFD